MKFPSTSVTQPLYGNVQIQCGLELGGRDFTESTGGSCGGGGGGGGGGAGVLLWSLYFSQFHVLDG